MRAVLNAGCLLAAVSTAHGQSEFRLLPQTLSKVRHVSANGGIVGGGVGRQFEERPMLWTMGPIIISTPVSLPFGFEEGIVASLAADGRTALVKAFDGPGTEIPHRWVHGGGITALPIPSGWDFTHGYAITPDGASIVGSTHVRTVGQRAVRWNGVNPPEILPMPANTASAIAVTTDGRGAVYGAASEHSLPHQIVRWQNGQVDVLVSFPFQQSVESTPVAVDTRGRRIVGMTQSFASMQEISPWILENGVVTPLPFPPNSMVSEPTGMDGRGRMIVGWSQNSSFQNSGWIWTERRGLVEATEFLRSLGADPTGITITTVLGISSDGRTLIGGGTVSPGVTQGWVATIPSPAAGAVMLAGFLAISARRRG